MKKRHLPSIVASVLVVLIASVVFLLPFAGNQIEAVGKALPAPSQTVSPSEVPSPSGTATLTPSEAEPGETPNAVPSQTKGTGKSEPSKGASSSGKKSVPEGTCSAQTKEPFVPVKYKIPALDMSHKVLSLPTQNNFVPVPPPSDRTSAAWWNEGPVPGSSVGKAILSIHTYRPSLSPAVGNHLFKGGKSALSPGDVIELHGANGEIACYDFQKAEKVSTYKYDPESNVMVDFEGKPSLVIVICWDFDQALEDWHSRVFFQAVQQGR